MTIRRADEADIETLVEIQRAASTRAYAHVYPPDRFPFPDEAVRTEVARRIAGPHTTYLLAEDDGHAIGLAGVSPGWLEQLYVAPDAQGRGVGTALLDAAVALRREEGDPELRLWTLEENHSGRRFYEGRGWRLGAETRVVPYPPHPIDVSYVLAL